MSGTVLVNSWVAIREGSEFTFSICSGNDAHVAVHGDEGLVFEFELEAEPLREFLDQGRKILVEMDAIDGREEAESEATEPAEHGHAVEHPA